MGGGHRAHGAQEAKGRTCLKCGEPLPESRRWIPRLFCSRRHAAEAAFTALLVVLAIVRALRWWGILG